MGGSVKEYPSEKVGRSARRPPLRFSLRAMFVVTALAAILAAGASYGGPAGFVFTLLAMSVISCLVTYFTGRLRLSNALGLLAVVIVIAVVLLPAFYYSPRINTRRDACENTLRQLGLALLDYESVHGSFPPVHSVDETGEPRCSWRTMILPCIEYNRLYAQYFIEEAWDGPHNSKITGQRVDHYQCPSDLASGPNSNDTSYVAVVGKGTAWTPGRGAKLREFRDGAANTILLIEMKNSGIKWAEPRDLDLNNLPPGITKQNLLQSLSKPHGRVQCSVCRWARGVYSGDNFLGGLRGAIDDCGW